MRPVVAVVGAGAAGLMTAIGAARAARAQDGEHPRILLFDSRKKVGAKILISGGTRCNVTNQRVRPADYRGGPSHFVTHVLEAFDPDKTRGLFSSIGVKLVLEPSGKYFPVSHSGRTVLEALLAECERLGVECRFGEKVTGIEPSADGLVLITAEGKIPVRRAALCTGGLSLPETGSDGTGLEIARTLGHTILPTGAALTPYLTKDKDWTSLSGLSLEVELSHFSKGRKRAAARGGFLFTHFGFSGPASLDLSRFWSLAGKDDGPRVEANFLPNVKEEDLRAGLERIRPTTAALCSLLTSKMGLPQRFVNTWIRKCGWTAADSALGRDWQRRVLMGIFHYPLEVSGVYGYKKAEATAGGVDLREVRVSNMASKKVPGLYFAGEILDVDGRIGGYNFQWAWSTGAIAGRSLVKDPA